MVSLQTEWATTFERLPRATQFDVVFVVGMHKSGTSLLTEILSLRDFYDPSRLTNPAERGYGNQQARYITRECRIIRHINSHFRPDQRDWESLAPMSVAHAKSLMLAYFRIWNRPIVIKSPFFTYSLLPWVEAANRAGLNTCVCVTTRPAAQLLNAWQCAPFTRGLLARGENVKMIESLSRQLTRLSSIPRLSIRYFSLHELKQLRASMCMQLRGEN